MNKNNGEVLPDLTQRKVYSPAWNYFKRISLRLAKCDLCKKKLSYKTSITNLKRHLLLKHKVNLGFKVSKPFLKIDSQVDVKRLIALVKQHPCLWDKNCTSFNNLRERNVAWKNIAFLLCPGMDRIEAVAKLSETYVAVSEHFFADKLRSPAEQVSPYNNDLEFLNPAPKLVDTPREPSLQEPDMEQHMDVFEINELDVKEEPLDDTFNSEFQESVVEVSADDGASSQVTADNRDDSSRWEKGNKYVVVNTSTPTEARSAGHKQEDEMMRHYSLELNNADKDVLFLLSMTEDMKRVPKELKTEFKGEFMMTVLRLVQKYRRGVSDNYFAEEG